MPLKVTKRDINPKVCYEWEHFAFPDSPHCKPEVGEYLIRLVHTDVIRLVGEGGAHPSPDVTFNIQRDGLARGRWGLMEFHTGGATLETLLHETAHSLTWSGQGLYALARARERGANLAGIQHHLSYVLCDRGHGPRFVACLIALMQRYAGTDPVKPLKLARDYSLRVDEVTLEYWQRLWGRY